MAHGPDLENWLALSLTPGLGDESLRKLLVAFGDPGAILGTRPGALSKVVAPQLARQIGDGAGRALIGPVLAWLGDPANHVITLGDADYPRLLLEIPDPPRFSTLKVRPSCSTALPSPSSAAAAPLPKESPLPNRLPARSATPGCASSAGWLSG